MGYTGGVYPIPCDTGGFNANPNLDFIPPNSLVDGSRNINLHTSGRAKRGGTKKVFTTPVTGSPQIMGLFDYRLANNSFQVFSASDGNLYKNSTTTIKTGLSTTKYPSFCVFGSDLFMANGNDPVQTWDGAAGSTSDITTPAADWTGTNQPFQMIPHGRGASRRMWAILGNAVYHSSLNNGKEFAAGTSGKITIETNDAYGLTGGIEFGNRLFVFSRDKGFLIDDTDSTYTNWGYEAGIWLGGAASWRLIVRVPNDVIVMAEDGDIYSLTAVQSYGDYKQASLTRPAFMDRWIRENIDTSQIDKFHAVYDPILRAVKFFVVRMGSSAVDTALVYFVDRPPSDAWMIHDNLIFPSGYNASCSAVVRRGAGDYVVFTGGYDGDLWTLEESDKNDAGNYFNFVLKTPFISMENIRLKKSVRSAIISLNSRTEANLKFEINTNGERLSSFSEIYAQGVSSWGTGTWGTMKWAKTDIGRLFFSVGEKGQYFQLTISNSKANEDVFVGNILLDFQPLGIQPE